MATLLVGAITSVFAQEANTTAKKPGAAPIKKKVTVKDRPQKNLQDAGENGSPSAGYRNYKGYWPIEVPLK